MQIGALHYSGRTKNVVPKIVLENFAWLFLEKARGREIWHRQFHIFPC